jgi:AcrR family transcriptional regulator
MHLHFKDIMDRHEITIDQLAEKSGYAKSTIYEYTGGSKQGKYMMWPALLTALFELTGDSELFLSGRREIVCYEQPRDSYDMNEIKVLVENTRAQAMLLESIAEIFADGIIDKNDADNIRRFNQASMDAVCLILHTKEAINNRFNDAIRK